MPEPVTGNGGRLAPCPGKPNCVSSDTTDARHHVPPLQLSVAPDGAWRATAAAVEALPRTVVVERTENYLRAEARSAVFRFVDDLELELRPEDGVIAVRSAARTGYWDFGVNRRRVESLRRALRATGTVR